jgi:hypothetical protein
MKGRRAWGFSSVAGRRKRTIPRPPQQQSQTNHRDAGQGHGLGPAGGGHLECGGGDAHLVGEGGAVVLKGPHGFLAGGAEDAELAGGQIGQGQTGFQPQPRAFAQGGPGAGMVGLADVVADAVGVLDLAAVDQGGQKVVHLHDGLAQLVAGLLHRQQVIGLGQFHHFLVQILNKVLQAERRIDLGDFGVAGVSRRDDDSHRYKEQGGDDSQGDVQ